MARSLLVIHILAAGAWFGASVVQFYVSPRLNKRGGAAAAAWQNMILGMGKTVYPIAAVTLLVTGFGLIGVSNDAFGYGDTFVIIGIAMVVVGAVLGIVVFGPSAEGAAAAFESGDDQRGVALANKAAPFGALDTVLLIFTIVVMVNRWGAG